MPKIKTRKAAAKRFRFTAKGKIVRKRAGTRHILEWKSSRQKRRLSKTIVVKKSDVARIKSMLPGAY
jgi:large subunit ribosomal protein L35